MKHIQLFENFKKNYKEKIAPSEFKKIEIGKTVLYGSGSHTVIDNDGFVLTLKGKDDKILTVNLNQFNDKGAINEALSVEQKKVEKFLKGIAKEFDYSIQDAARFVKDAISKMNLNELSEINEARSIAKIEKDRAATVSSMAEIVQNWKSAREEGDKQKEASFLQKLKELTAKKKSLEQELNAIISDKDRYIELVITEQNVIFESVMSDINLIAKEAKSYKDFVKEFTKKYSNLADTGNYDHFEKWLKSIYDARGNESIDEGETAIKSIGDHWFETYGENFVKEYPKMAKIVKMHPQVDARTLSKWWDEIYGEDFKKKYPAMWNKLNVKI
jgi:hypothetical protein